MFDAHEAGTSGRPLSLCAGLVALILVGTLATAGTTDTLRLSANAITIAVPSGSSDPEGAFREVRLFKSVRVPMRDGVRLSTDIYLPVGAALPLPVVQIRLPYNKNTYGQFRQPTSVASFFASHGYAVAIQDMRGRYESEGDYVVSKTDRNDGYDTVEWLSKQAWSNGKIGSYGCSYLGENQVQLAAERHPSHAAAIPHSASGAYVGTHRPFAFLTGGAFELASGFGWFHSNGSKAYVGLPGDVSDADFARRIEQFQTGPVIPEVNYAEAFRWLPLIDLIKMTGISYPTDYEDFVSHSPADPYWDSLNYITDKDRFDVPALHIDSWYDLSAAETLALFKLFRDNAVTARARDNQYLIMGPTTHCRTGAATENTIVGEREMGDARIELRQIELQWFDYWLKNEVNGILDMPHARYYLMGKNEWRSADTWPPRGTTRKTYYLHSGGRANSRLGDGSLSTRGASSEPPDSYVYDPEFPVPSIGGPICCISTSDAPAGSYDQSEVELRHDILVYSTPPLAEGLTVVGSIEAVLFVSSSAKDTDFTVKLVDVYPDGRAFNVQEGILRARYREGYERSVRMEAGKAYELRVNLHATANYFGPGHQIRLEVSSSNFPRFDRNLNTGGNNYDETEWVVAENTVHHSREHPSRLQLSVLPEQ